MITKPQPATVNYADYLNMKARTPDEAMALKAAMKPHGVAASVVDALDLSKSFGDAVDGAVKDSWDAASVHRAILEALNLQIDRAELYRSVMAETVDYVAGYPTDGQRFHTSDGDSGISVGRLPVFSGQHVLVRDDGTRFICGGWHLNRPGERFTFDDEDAE